MAKHEGDRLPKSVVEIFQRELEATERRGLEVRDLTLAKWHDALKTQHPDPGICLEAARCHRKRGAYQEALAVLEQGLQFCAPSISLYGSHVRILQECNQAREAIAAAHAAARLFPADISIKLMEALMLPVLYDSVEELEYYRQRYTQGLHRFRGETRLDTMPGGQQALSAMGSHANTLLAYQGRDDRELNAIYGGLVHQIMAANYPDWVHPLRVPPAVRGDKLRIGYVSSRFRNFSAMKYFLGWLRGHDKERFAIYAYHTSRKVDPVTEEAKRICDSFRQCSNSLEETARVVLADSLHVLVFLDIGMDSVMSQLAALRLVPIQCLAWDHPVTSGLPTVDYFLSSELAEPENARDHYSETLVPLPGVGVCYPKPVIPTVLLQKTRQDFQLRDGSVLYMCCQEARKFLPQQDALIAQIASRVPNSQFVFLLRNSFVENDLRRRLDRAFSTAGLQANDHCVLLSELDRFSFWNLLLLGDVFLDAIGWSGGVTTFEAIACRLPVVTLPGLLMRSRQSAAILTQLGTVDTIAHDTQEYVEIAIRLGLEPQWRKVIRQRMASSCPSLYSDKRCVGALEEFYEKTVRERIG